MQLGGHMSNKDHRRIAGVSTAFCLSAIMCTMIYSDAWGQHTSLEMSVDPRTMAMGESFVAVPAYVGAMTSNPAGLAGIKGISLSYGQINENEENIRSSGYRSFRGAIHTAFVEIGLLYTRHNYGAFRFTAEQSPDGPVQEFNPYEYTVGISIGKKIADFSVGVGAKRYDRSGAYIPGSIYKTTVTKPLLFDFGVQYTFRFSSNDDPPNQQVSIGICYQNIGEDIKTETIDVFSQQTSSRFTTTIAVPQYLSIGLAYHFQTHAEVDERLMPFHFMITGEYRNRTNAHQDTRRDNWGVGVEGIVYEIVSFRIGGYGYHEESFVRLGAGLCAPLAKLGLDLPVSVRFEYAAMLDDPTVNGVHLFSLGLQYNQDVL